MRAGEREGVRRTPGDSHGISLMDKVQVWGFRLGSEVGVPKILGPQKEEGGKEGERVGRRVAIDIRSERVGPCKAGERVRSTDGDRE